MRRRSSATPFGERVILFLYWLLSGYGLRASRAFSLFLVLVVASGALLHFLAPRAAGDTTLLAGMASALEGALDLASPTVSLPLPVRFLRIAIRIAAPILLGLGALAIRNRIKR
jgi:hypothetical protein